MSRQTDNPDFEVLDEACRLAEDVLVLVRDSLLVGYRFLNRPFAQLPVRVRMDIRTCATDARELLFSPGFVLDSFRNAPHVLTRAYLHMTLHCLLRHPFVPKGADMLRWSCACDACVCALMGKLGGPAQLDDDPSRDRDLARLVDAVSQPTASAIYDLLARLELDEAELARLELLFGADMHDRWAADEEIQRQGSAPDEASIVKLQEQWEKVARQTQMDIERSDAGDEAASLVEALVAGEADAMGLEELLRQFAAPSEAIQVNPDEFDYIYYTYGLSTYGNMPLVEPLEYCDSPHLRDFAVVIDTSGSVDRELAAAFVERACGMLLSAAAFGPTSRVRVIQCDNRVQDERVLREPDDVRAYLDDFEIKGRGGTDFRPAFDHVCNLVESGDIGDMAGLVYFTDGQGEFPSEAPTYDVAFVFVDKLAPVPPWATAVLTYSDDLKAR